MVCLEGPLCVVPVVTFFFIAFPHKVIFLTGSGASQVPIALKAISDPSSLSALKTFHLPNTSTKC